MTYGEFLSRVRASGDYPDEEAATAVDAVVRTLGERLPQRASQHLADQLPQPVAGILEDASDIGRPWGVEEFLTQVALHTGEDRDTAETDTRNVFSAISERVSGGEMNKLLSQLPSGYAELFGYSELA
ncbi:DUF2267 domain-containing protein [Streptomyces avicenniae]|uniref:DUF2267 domain-containing protein n=1 Tax=Streptomyces avicenniae TaxID=500153 RepID=UPI0006995635|nr:DUF2267 domain-containing protein [Streptomyces avicenniae]